MQAQLGAILALDIIKNEAPLPVDLELGLQVLDLGVLVREGVLVGGLRSGRRHLHVFFGGRLPGSFRSVAQRRCSCD